MDHNINSYFHGAVHDFGEEEIRGAEKKLSEMASRLSRRSPMYLLAAEYFRRYYLEGPVRLDELARHVDNNWRQMRAQFAIVEQQRATTAKLLSAYFKDGLPAVEIDVSGLIEHEAPEPLAYSAIVSLGRAPPDRSPKIQLHFSMSGSGLEYLGRFIGDDPIIDRYIEEQRARYLSSRPDSVPVELHYRALGVTHDIMPRSRVFARRLVLSDRYADEAGPQDLRPSDVVAYVDDDTVRFFDLRHREDIHLVMPHAVNFAQSSHRPLFTILGALTKPAVCYLDLDEAFSKLGYMPRLTFKSDIWLRPRTWVPSREELDGFKGGGPDALRAFRLWLEKRLAGLKEFEIAAGESRLSIRLDDDAGLQLAVREIVRNAASVRESFAEIHPLLPLSKTGLAYNHELILRFDVEGKAQRRLPAIRTFDRGASGPSDPHWLYYQIFCAADRIEPLLLQPISQLVERLGAESLISSWFFIRYDENGSHIRLRLKAPRAALRWRVTEQVEKLLFLLEFEGHIAAWSASPFVPEWVRYSELGTALAADLFWSDTRSALTHLRQCSSLPVEGRIQADALYAAERTHRYLMQAGWTADKRISFLRDIAGKRSSGDDIAYRDSALRVLVPTIAAAELSSETSLPPDVGTGTLASLSHMSCNRAMLNWTRDRERAAYRLLLRGYQIIKHAPAHHREET